MRLGTRLVKCVVAGLIVGGATPALTQATTSKPDGVLVQHADGRISVDRGRRAVIAPRALAARTSHRPAVRFAEPNYRYAAAAAPDDPLFDEQWSLADSTVIGADQAWNQTAGSSDVVVAVIDSGIDLDHPDLVANLWTNTREIPGNSVDDDGNGFIDDTRGWNFVGETPNPDDDNGHGTHVAGIIGAQGGNGIGIAGVAWKVRMMPIKVLDADAVGSAATLARGIRYAVANGAKVINLSVSGPSYSKAFDEAIQLASDSGVLIVGAAGNDGRNVESDPVYPAGFTAPLLLSVSATAPGGGLSSISNFGSRTVEIAAPGQDIVSTALGGGYERRTGTSMAAPHVVGAAVLLAAARADLGAAGWRDALLSAARRGLPVMSGTLNISGALHTVLGAQYKPSAAKTASVHRAACSLRRARALSAASAARRRGAASSFVAATATCTSSATNDQLGL